MKFDSLILILLQVTFLLRVGTVKGILGGEDVEEGQFTYQASILVENIHKCGAAIISNQHVISAAHCFMDDDGNFENVQFSVFVGSMDLLSEDPQKLVIDAEKIYIPKQYNCSMSYLKRDADIAVVKLARRLELSSNNRLSKLELPPHMQTYSIYDNEKAIITGFGTTSVIRLAGVTGFLHPVRLGPPSNTLKYAETTVIPIEKCMSMYFDLISENVLCAQINGLTTRTPKGICAGDSGSPLVLNGNTIIGVLAVGQYDCDERVVPGIYTSIPHFIPLIHKAMRDEWSSELRIAEYQRKKFIGWLCSKKILKEISRK